MRQENSGRLLNGYPLFFNIFFLQQKTYLCNQGDSSMKNTLQAQKDSHLLSAMQHGDKKAYGTLFRRYYPMLCSYANRFVSLEDAEEIVQDVMLWLWENKETQMFNTSFSQYLYKAVYHRCINQLTHQQSQLRAETRFYEYMLEMLQDSDFSQTEDLKKHISQAIQALPASYREAFVMHRFENKSYKEIADILQVSTQTVNYRIQQALKQLRVTLKDYLPLILLLFPKNLLS